MQSRLALSPARTRQQVPANKIARLSEINRFVSRDWPGRYRIYPGSGRRGSMRHVSNSSHYLPLSVMDSGRIPSIDSLLCNYFFPTSDCLCVFPRYQDGRTSHYSSRSLDTPCFPASPLSSLLPLCTSSLALPCVAVGQTCYGLMLCRDCLIVWVVCFTYILLRVFLCVS